MTITLQQAREKWDALSPEMRAVLFSEKNENALLAIYDARKLATEARRAIAKIVGYGLLGLLRLEDVKNEIAKAGGLDSASAGAIGSDVENKVFIPLKADLAALRGGRVSDITPPKPVAPRPLPPVALKPSAAGAAAPQRTPAPTAAPSPAKTPVPAKAPAPFVIHKESEFSPVAPTAGGKADMKAQADKIASFFRKDAAPATPNIAKVQIGAYGAAPATPPAAPTKTGPEIPRVVHYGELKTMLEAPAAAVPVAPGKTAPVPLGAIGPMLQVAPKPPMPATRPAIPGVQGVPPRPPLPPADHPEFARKPPTTPPVPPQKAA